MQPNATGPTDGAPVPRWRTRLALIGGTILILMVISYISMIMVSLMEEIDRPRIGVTLLVLWTLSLIALGLLVRGWRHHLMRLRARVK